MEDLYYAGGLPAVIKELLPQLHGDSITVNGKTVRENNEAASCYNTDVISPVAQPFNTTSGIIVLKETCVWTGQ
jgi:dihydroxy-acid dehydratase